VPCRRRNCQGRPNSRRTKDFRRGHAREAGFRTGKANLITNARASAAPSPAGTHFAGDKNHWSVVNNPKYWGATGGLEYEAAWSLGAAEGVDDLDAA